MTDVVREVSPLAPGRYWLDLVNEARGDFLEWVKEMAGAVRVESTEEDAGDAPSLFVIFIVPDGREPFLPADRLGFPHKAPPNVKFRRDTLSRPDEPLDASERLQAAFENMSPVGWLVLAGAVLLLMNEGKGRR